MGSRRVQRTGGSSYTVTLPKKWVRENDVKSRGCVDFIACDNGCLLIRAHQDSISDLQRKTIWVDGVEGHDFLFRLLVASYITGYDEIELKSKKRIDTVLREAATEFTQVAVGPEIVSEKVNSLLIRDLMDPRELPSKQTIKRMRVLVQTMVEDALTSYTRSDSKLAKEVVLRDIEVDRLYWFICRRKSRRVNSFGCWDSKDDSLVFSLATMLERIADHAVIIARNQRVLSGKIGDGLVKKIRAAGTLSTDILYQGMDSWAEKDMRKANDAIESHNDLVNACERILSAKGGKGVSSVPLVYVAESIRRVGEYSVNICEYVMDWLVEDF